MALRFMTVQPCTPHSANHHAFQLELLVSESRLISWAPAMWVSGNITQNIWIHDASQQNFPQLARSCCHNQANLLHVSSTWQTWHWWELYIFFFKSASRKKNWFDHVPQTEIPLHACHSTPCRESLIAHQR